ncbi:peptidoglycan-binding protein [Streptomyces sp. NPDC096012]|uniref:peptidoglycan-binding domain-containing protein n=1 Tax=Streptomyces sp. NPDC096012 TaxID=3155684 RepID=UPI00336A63F8
MDGPGSPESAAADRFRRPSRRAVLLSTAGAGAAVVAVAGFAGGLFSYHAPARDRAAVEVRQSVPDATSPGPASPTAPEPPAAPRSPGRSPSTPAAPSPSPSPSSSSPSPSASHSAAGSPSPARPSAPSSAAPITSPAPAPVLRRGDSGPEVRELQLRLRQLNLYGGPVDSVFSRSVEDGVRVYQLARGVRGDEPGVYGPATRASLEAETSEP